MSHSDRHGPAASPAFIAALNLPANMQKHLTDQRASEARCLAMATSYRERLRDLTEQMRNDRRDSERRAALKSPQSATSRWHGAVDALQARGRTKVQAVREVVTTQPALNAEYLQEVSSGEVRTA